MINNLLNTRKVHINTKNHTKEEKKITLEPSHIPSYGWFKMNYLTVVGHSISTCTIFLHIENLDLAMSFGSQY